MGDRGVDCDDQVQSIDQRGGVSEIRQAAGDRAEAERLRAGGLERARKFSWERTAALTLESYRRALGAGK